MIFGVDIMVDELWLVFNVICLLLICVEVDEILYLFYIVICYCFEKVFIDEDLFVVDFESVWNDVYVEVL